MLFKQSTTHLGKLRIGLKNSIGEFRPKFTWDFEQVTNEVDIDLDRDKK